MANAFLLAPMTATVVAVAGTVRSGAADYTLNDYAGVVFEAACDEAGVSQQIEYDLGAEKLIDTVMVFGLEQLPKDATCYILFRDAAGQVIHDDLISAYAGTVPVAGKGVTLWMAPAPIMARSVRLNFQATGPGASVRISRVAIGQRIKLERNFGYGAAFGVRDLGSLDFSARGVLLRRRAKKLRTVGLTFSNINKDEVEQMTGPLLERIGNTELVALVTDPAPDAQRQNRCYFGPLVGDLSHAWRKARLFEAKANLVSLF